MHTLRVLITAKERWHLISVCCEVRPPFCSFMSGNMITIQRNAVLCVSCEKWCGHSLRTSLLMKVLWLSVYLCIVKLFPGCIYGGRHRHRNDHGSAAWLTTSSDAGYSCCYDLACSDVDLSLFMADWQFEDTPFCFLYVSFVLRWVKWVKSLYSFDWVGHYLCFCRHKVS